MRMNAAAIHPMEEAYRLCVVFGDADKRKLVAHAPRGLAQVVFGELHVLIGAPETQQHFGLATGNAFD